ncbi:MAG: hypothetical protein AB7K24_31765 [Gemmataceae bacterium]
MRVPLLALLIVVSVGGAVSADENPKEYPVKLTATIGKPDAQGRQVVQALLTIRKGYRIFANPVDHEDLQPLMTTMTISGGESLRPLDITYPKGELVKNEVVGSYRIYTNSVALKATVSRAEGDREPLTVKVYVLPIDDSGCRFPPRALTVRVPVN